MPPTPKTRDSKAHVEYEDKLENMYIPLGGRKFSARGVRKVTTGIRGLWQPNVAHVTLATPAAKPLKRRRVGKGDLLWK